MNSLNEKSIVIACDHVVRERVTILRVARDEPMDESDSGWQVHCGGSHTEADGCVISVKALLMLDPTLQPFLSSPAGTVLERAGVADKWKKLR